MELFRYCHHTERRIGESHLELLVYALQTVDGRVQVSDFVALHLELLLEVLNFANMRITFCSVLCLKFILAMRSFSKCISL